MHHVVVTHHCSTLCSLPLLQNTAAKSTFPSCACLHLAQYEDFVDLRLTEAEKLFPEGLAGGGQGALERAASRSTSTALLNREAADALILSLDQFAAAAAAEGGEGEEGAPFGIKGTSSENWLKIYEARQYGTTSSAGKGEGEQGGDGDGAGGRAAGTGEAPPDGDDDDDGHDDIMGDVRAAAAEGAAAAAAAAEAVMAAAVTAAGNSGGEGSELEGQEGGEGTEKKAVLGSGPIWEEMKALAESKKKALKGVRRVGVRPGQVRPWPLGRCFVLLLLFSSCSRLFLLLLLLLTFVVYRWWRKIVLLFVGIFFTIVRGKKGFFNFVIPVESFAGPHSLTK